MMFAVPAGLVMLALVPLIVLWHLLRLRRRRVVVASVEPWRRLMGVSRRRRRLPPLMLLALHATAAGALGLAAGDPRLPTTERWSGDVAIVLDVGVGMAAADRWQVARAAVGDAIGTPGKVTLVTAGLRPRVRLVRGHAAAARQALATLLPGEAGADLTEATRVAARLGGAAARLVVVTDEPSPQDAGVAWIDVSEGMPLDNVAVTAADVREGRLFARIANYSGGPRTVSLGVEVDGRRVDQRDVALGPGESADAVWPLPGDAALAVVALEGADALPLDDTAIVAVGRRVRRGQMVGASPAVERALAALDGWQIQRTGRATYGVDGAVELSVFVGPIPDPLPPGGVLVVAPGTGAVSQDTGAQGETSASATDPSVPAPLAGSRRELEAVGAHPLTAGLDLAGAHIVPLASDVPPWADPILSSEGTTAAFAGSIGESRVVVLAFDPDDPGSNLAHRPAFPLLVARAVDWVAGAPPPGAVAVGQAVPLPRGEYQVTNPDGSVTTTTGHAQPFGPGLHVARRTGSAPHELSFGARSGDDQASDLRTPRQAVFAPQEPSAAGPEVPPTGRPAGPALAAAAMLLVLVEGAWRARPLPAGQDAERR